MAGIRGESRFFTHKIERCTSKMVKGLSNKELRMLKRKTSRDYDDAMALTSNVMGALYCVGREFERRKLKK
jgi:hypothetical protein